MDSQKLMDKLNSNTQNYNKEIRIMEVCGTHTQSISKSGIRHILPKQVKLLSGPGCPVCVTDESYIDMVIEMLSNENIIIVTFGDMLKVRGTSNSLVENKSKVYTVYSPEDAITLALKNKEKTVVFLAVGFETTAPIFAAMIKNVYKNGPDNLLFFTALKRMEPVLRLILQDDRNKIDGIICPGHVASVLGAEAFHFITDKYGIPAVICGFEVDDITQGISLLLEQITEKKPITFTNLYNRCVTPQGNKTAQHYMNEVFHIDNADWRGIGQIPNSALVINNRYEKLDAKKKLNLKEKNSLKTSCCQCSEIILGIKTPNECKQFGKNCNPDNPLGPCMVSSEGACSVYYRYSGRI